MDKSKYILRFDTSDKIKKLKAVLAQKHEVKKSILSERASLRQELIKRLNEQISKKFNTRLSIANRNIFAIDDSIEEEKVKIEEQYILSGLPYPLGTVFVYWDWDFNLHSPNNPIRVWKTSKRTILQTRRTGNRCRRVSLELIPINKKGEPKLEEKRIWWKRHDWNWALEGTRPEIPRWLGVQWSKIRWDDKA